MRLDQDLIASGCIQQNGTPGGTNPAKNMIGVASAVTDGEGVWTIQCNDTTWDETDVELILTPGISSNAGSQGISFGVSSQPAAGAITVITYRNDDGTPVAVSFYFSIKRNRQYSWD